MLAEAAQRGVPLDHPLLVRHHLVGLPDGAAVERARGLLGQDGYAVQIAPEGPPAIAVLATLAGAAGSIADQLARLPVVRLRVGPRRARPSMPRPTGISGPPVPA